VEDRSGRALGTVHAIHDFGAGDVLELRGPQGETLYLPFTRDAVPTVDIAGGRLVADPPVETGDPEPQGGTDEGGTR
jgi:16S rRNA processing protein RimM